MNQRHLTSWQIATLVIGGLLMFGPFIWDMLTGTFVFLAEIDLMQLFTRDGLFVIGLLAVLFVGFYELIRDERDKPTSKYTK